MNHLQMLTRYKAWADQQLLAVASGMSEEALAAPQSIVFGSLLRTMHHVYAMDLVWQANLLGQSHGFTSRNPVDCPPIEELALLQADIDAWYVNYAETLTEAEHDEDVTFTFIAAGPGIMSREAMLLHVVNHATYHRGHVGDMMYACGVEPPTTDLPVFLKEKGSQS